MGVGVMFIGFICIVWSGWMWWREAQPYLEKMKQPRKMKTSSRQEMENLRVAIINMFRLLTDGRLLVVDIIITVFTTSIFGFGGGAIGGVFGLFTSNVISVILVVASKKIGDKK